MPHSWVAGTPSNPCHALEKAAAKPTPCFVLVVGTETKLGTAEDKLSEMARDPPLLNTHTHTSNTNPEGGLSFRMQSTPRTKVQDSTYQIL